MMTRKSTALYALLLLFCPMLSDEQYTIDNAISKKLIQAEIKGKRGFTGQVIDMKVKNISPREITILIEPGRKLHPSDPSMQDIMVTQKMVVILPVKAEKLLLINGMCCISGNKPPVPGIGFSVGKMADSAMVEVARYIDANKLYADHAAQHAVWVFSDNKRIEGIDITEPANKPLIELVCKLKHSRKPEYSIEYEQEPGAAFSGKAVNVKGFFKTHVEKQCMLTMALYDSNGKQLSSDNVPGPPKPGTYNFEYGFKVKGYAPGVYYGKVIIDGKVKSEVKLEI